MKNKSTDNNLALNKPLVSIPLAIVFFLAGAVALFGFTPQSRTGDDKIEQSKSSMVKNPRSTRGKLGAPTKFEEYTFYELPNDLDKAEIHEILFHKGAMWLGTDKGLVKIVDQEVTTYTQFSDWSFEWVRNLAVTPNGIATSVHVAHGNTGGEGANSHVFDVENETWHEIGPNVLDQEWHKGYLYQVNKDLIRRDPKELWQDTVVVPAVCGRGASRIKMKVIENELWIVGTGSQFGGWRSSGSIGCGATRFIPSSGKSFKYHTTDGLNHDYGWDLDGDDKGVYVSHSIKHNRLSHFDFERERWSEPRLRGAGNRISISSNGIWLARGSPLAPLHRIDRGTNEGRLFSKISDNTYLSAIAINGKEVWVGAYEKKWTNSTYTITSRLGMIVDE